jgi:hypothetical protein
VDFNAILKGGQHQELFEEYWLVAVGGDSPNG